MTDSLKAAAKAGDIKALEALMNRSFESKGVTVRVTSSGALLKVVVRGKDAPDKALLPTIQKGLASISPKGFDQVIVTARAIGNADAWSQQWDLPKNPHAELLSVAAGSSPVPKPAVKVLASRDQSKSWYQKNWLIISLLVLFPFAGIPLAWTSKWPKVNKIGASIVSGLWLSSSFLIQQPNKTQPRIAQDEISKPTTELAVAEDEEASVEASTPDPDRTFADAVNQAMAAAEATQTARNPDEWEKAASLWTQAIELMKAVPEASENYQTAQQKITDYQPNLEYSQKNARKPIVAQSVPQPYSGTNRVPDKSIEEKLAVIDGLPGLESTYGRLLDQIDAKCTQDRTQIADIVVRSVEVAFQNGHRTNTLDMLEAGQIAVRSTDFKFDCVEIFSLIVTMMDVQQE
jgi:hypothetical protein